MRFGKLILTSSAIGLLNMNFGILADSFFSECKGNQRSKGGGFGIEATYKFKLGANGVYIGSAEYWNTTNNRSFEGDLKNIVITPEKVNFSVTYSSGAANGDTAEIVLMRNGNILRGSGENKARGTEFDIDLKCK
jgi:hypothetical protein